MRRRSPERRTLPSRTWLTFSCSAIVAMPTSFPLNENDDVRAMTFSGSICASRFRISSEMPSEKYSCWASPLRFLKGNTAIDCSIGPSGHHLSQANISTAAASIAMMTKSTRRPPTWAACLEGPALLSSARPSGVSS